MGQSTHWLVSVLFLPNHPVEMGTLIYLSRHVALTKQPYAVPSSSITKKAQLMPEPTLELLKGTMENVLQPYFSSAFHLF